jgi:5-methylcytosine-specific restriction endonuclease McrA
LSGLIQLKSATYAAIEERYLCIHQRREIRRRIIADGRVSYVSQCEACGHTSLPISAKKALAQSPSPPPYDHVMESRWRAAKSAEYVRAYHELKPALRAEYLAYLASPQWAQKRIEILERANGLCEICAQIASQVHHLHYRNIGKEQAGDLMAVCRVCHELIHAQANA